MGKRWDSSERAERARRASSNPASLMRSAHENLDRGQEQSPDAEGREHGPSREWGLYSRSRMLETLCLLARSKESG